MPDGFLPRRLLVDGFQRQCDFNEFLFVGHGSKCCADSHPKAVLKFFLKVSPEIIEGRVRVFQVIKVFDEYRLKFIENFLWKADYSWAIRTVGILG